jgi:hypothetical protein
MKKEYDHLGQHLAIEMNQECAIDDLRSHPSFGIGGDFEQEEIRLGLAAPARLDQPVGQSAVLHDFGLKRLPRFEIADAPHPEDRIAVMLDQPLTALVVPLHVKSTLALSLDRSRAEKGDRAIIDNCPSEDARLTFVDLRDVPFLLSPFSQAVKAAMGGLAAEGESLWREISLDWSARMKRSTALLRA